MTRQEKEDRGVQTTTLTIGTVALERALKGLELPARKDEILLKAEENNAPDDVFFALDRLEDRNYASLDDIIVELS